LQQIERDSENSINRDCFELNWPQLTQQLKLTGMAKMLAQHSESKVMSTESIELCVPEVHKHLLEKRYQDRIREALNNYLGKSIALSFSVGSVTGLTPAALQQQEKEEERARAIAAIEKDSMVQELIEQFDAKLIVSSIKPIQK
jgi:DNA polymerase-3 subunit gamma/tau